jgi:hypothetical protein
MIANIHPGRDSRLGEILKVTKHRNSIESFRRKLFCNVRVAEGAQAFEQFA